MSSYPGISLPVYDSVVNATMIGSNIDYTSSGGKFYSFSYSSTLNNKKKYIDYIEAIGWSYHDSNVNSEYSVYFMNKGSRLVGVYYYFGEDRVSVAYIID